MAPRYAYTLTGIVSHATEWDAAGVRALRASHDGGDPEGMIAGS
ncbi:hypothetical protein [Streptomyces sp. NPDC048269]